jgi:pimeloyl-ACP methyl ester carboxylesterase
MNQIIQRRAQQPSTRANRGAQIGRMVRRSRMSILLLGILVYRTSAQLPVGHYEGAVSRDGSVQLVRADLDTTGGRISGTFDIPELMDFEVSIPPATWRDDTLVLWLNYGDFLCRYFPATDEMTGISEQWQPKIRLHLKKGGSKVVHFQREDVSFDDGEIHLAGILFKPVSITPIPFVVLIHGSGNVDRNSPSYHSLGYALAERGIGVLLYDKRGCGQSSGNWNLATLGDLADDAVAGLRFLKSRKDLQISMVGFVGTSQGGWITAIAANRTKDCDFAVLNVGPSVSVFDQDIHRVKYSMLGDGWPQAAIDSAVAYTRIYFRYTRSNDEDDWKILSRFAEQLRERAWVSYINLPNNRADFAWWRRNDYDPARDLMKISCPVLSILAERDMLVPPTENEARMDSLLRLSKSHYRIVVIPNVGHDELTFQGLNGDNWNWPDVYWQWRKRPDAIVETIASWIRGQ